MNFSQPYHYNIKKTRGENKEICQLGGYLIDWITNSLVIACLENNIFIIIVCSNFHFGHSWEKKGKMKTNMSPIQVRDSLPVPWNTDLTIFINMVIFRNNEGCIFKIRVIFLKKSLTAVTHLHWWNRAVFRQRGELKFLFTWLDCLLLC